MQNRRKGRKLSRRSGQRRALMKTLLGSLIMREKITTTLAKAKEAKNFIDQLVNKGKVAHAKPEKRVSMLRDLRVDLSAEATKKITSDFAKRFDGRASGYVRVTKLERRKSDSAEMAVIEFV